MIITLNLQPHEEANLLALAHAKGVSTTTLVREAIYRMLAESHLPPNAPKEPTISVRGILAKYGPAPSADEIDQNRAEMLANLPRDDF